MSLREIARAALAGGNALVQLRVEGKLRPQHFWVAARGGAQYVAAIAAGDEAPRVEVARRMRICRACPSRVRTRKRGERLGFCGQPLEEHHGERPTCGCLLDGAARVGSKRCWQGKWLVAPPNPPQCAP